MIEYIIGIVVIISLLLLISTIINSKLLLAVIKIEKAEEDIEMYLDKKKDFLERTKPIIKKELKSKDFLEDIDTINEDMSSFDINDKLKKYYNELFKILDENEKLFKSEALTSLLDSLNDNEEKILGAIKYYNDTVVDYNHLVMSFPSNVIAFFKGHKKMPFYNNEKREMFEILNER